MPIMYVDDSGSSKHTDHTDYFILSGIIVGDDKIKNLQRAVFEYQQANFTGRFIDAEIHTYDIYKKQELFAAIDQATKINLLDNLYTMISKLDCVGIISVVNKKKLQTKRPTWNILTVAWTFLLDQYDKYLKENAITDGEITIDKSSNKIQRNTTEIIDRTRHWGPKHQRILQSGKPYFADSGSVYGIQVADAFAYCALQHNKENEDFERYWRIISSKLKSRFNRTQNSTYKKYP